MAREWEWTLEEGTRVKAAFGGFGRITVSVDEREVAKVRNGMKMQTLAIPLPSGAPAELQYGAPFGAGLRMELRVAGQLLMPSKAPRGAARALTSCPHCGAAIRGHDKFCDACGKPLPSSEQLQLEAQVQSGNSAVGALSILFVLSGVVMYFIQRAQADKALADIASLSASQPLAEPLAGAATIGELRTQIEWEATSVLLVNGVLAAIMAGLWLWGKRKPSAAIVVAFCTYLVVLVVNAAIDPRTLAQGWIVKLLVISYLVRALKAAMALRSMTRSA